MLNPTHGCYSHFVNYLKIPMVTYTQVNTDETDFVPMDYHLKTYQPQSILTKEDQIGI